MIANTIEKWTKPIPKLHLSAPVIMVGPSGVGEGTMTKVLLQDHFSGTEICGVIASGK